MTDADIEAARLVLQRLADAMHGKRVCVHCGAPVERYYRVAPCVYAQPCGHRQWNGRLPG